jgi:hypothetical protein
MARVHPIEFAQLTVNDAAAENCVAAPQSASRPMHDLLDAGISNLVTLGAGMENGNDFSESLSVLSAAPREASPMRQQSHGEAAEPSTQRQTHRQITQKLRDHYDALPASFKGIARTFRSVPGPAPGFAMMIVAIFGACTMLQLVGAAYAANERGLNTRALHGLLGGILATCIVGAIFLVTAPTRVTGEFHRRYFLAIPVIIGIGTGLGFIRTGESHLSLLSIGIAAIAIGYVACLLCLNLPFYVSIEHKQLDRSLGPPIMIIGLLFFLWVALYAEVSRRESHFLVGVLLPLGAWITRVAALLLLSRSCHFKYFMPKALFLIAVEQPDSEADGVPAPLLGDLEMVYGYLVVLFALMIGCGSYASMLVSVMDNPNSTGWITGMAASVVLEIADRTSITQRLQLRATAHFKLERAARLVRLGAMKALFYQSQFSTQFAAPIMLLSIGCVRAVTLWDIRAVVWLDVNPTVVWVALAHFLSEMLVVELTVRVAQYKRFTKFVFVTADLPPHHPLGNIELRAFDMKGYAFVSLVGCTILYAIFLCFLGPAFVTGTARDYDPHNLGSWVRSVSPESRWFNFTNRTSNYTNITAAVR